MMPLAPQLSVPHIGQISASPKMKASKPKLSFSIDSIVGKRKTFDSTGKPDEHLNETELMQKSLKRHLSDIDLQSERKSNNSPNSAGQRSPDIFQRRQSVSPQSNGSANHSQIRQSESASPARSLSPISLVTNNTQQPPNALSHIPAQFMNRPGLGLNSNHSSISPGPQGNPGQMPQVAPLGHPNHPMMVAAAAAAAAASSVHQFPSMPSDYQQAAAFYPWFLRANPFAGRFPGMPFDSPLGSFLLPPFRKPKRIRTAFSPGQLLKLEQAFEKNHYVVGNERKQLANHLGLSETQVKVWFQNRRTKHKRQKQEDEEGTGSMNNGENGNANKDYSDDEEEIDLEDDDESVSDQEHDNNAHNNMALKFANMHHLWYQSMSAGLIPPDQTPVTSSNSA